jgi:hypothetical protein
VYSPYICNFAPHPKEEHHMYALKLDRDITYTVYVQTDKLQMMGRNTFWHFTTGTPGTPGL